MTLYNATAIKRIFLYWTGTNLSFLNGSSRYEQCSLRLFHGGGFHGISRLNGDSKWRHYEGLHQCSPTVVFKNLRIQLVNLSVLLLRRQISSHIKVQIIIIAPNSFTFLLLQTCDCLIFIHTVKCLCTDNRKWHLLPFNLK